MSGLRKIRWQIRPVWRVSPASFARQHAARSYHDDYRQLRIHAKWRLPTDAFWSSVRCSNHCLQLQDWFQSRKYCGLHDKCGEGVGIYFIMGIGPWGSWDYSPEVLVTHTKDLGQILQGLHTTSQCISGQPDIPTSLSVAQLALKHRQNKNLRQRIILFIGSPLTAAGADEKSMVRLAKKLKKNNVAVDVVCFGDEEGRDMNEPVLKAFVDNVISGDNRCINLNLVGLSDLIIPS